jgi:hypothetical protein
MKLAFFGILMAVILGFGILLGIVIGKFLSSANARMYNTSVILRQVQTLSHLVTVKYVMEKVEILEVPSENTIGRLVGSQNRLLLLAHGIVKAGTDLGKLNAEDIQVKGKRVVIRLPPAQITDAYLDEHQTKVIDRTTGLLAPSDKDLERTARQNAVDAIRRAARVSGILNDADERARDQLKMLFLQLGFEEVEFRSP